MYNKQTQMGCNMQRLKIDQDIKPLDANEYEAMQEKIELLTDIQTSLNQLEKGSGISHKDAKEKVLKRVLK